MTCQRQHNNDGFNGSTLIVPRGALNIRRRVRSWKQHA
jgi:hypothetical protein